jgi:hypothetical protein
MFRLYENPDDHLDRLNAERQRADRRRSVLRELRDAVPPFASASEVRRTRALRPRMSERRS